MRFSGAAAAAALTIGLVAPLGLTAPATAATGSVTDEAGDAAKRLDITRVTLRNDDARVVVRVTLARRAQGNLIVSLDRRRGLGARIVARRAKDGAVTGRVVRGSFSDRGAAARPVDCEGLRVRWRKGPGAVRLAMPATCLNDGNYGALRFAALTERGSADADYAPEGARGAISVSAWVPRG